MDTDTKYLVIIIIIFLILIKFYYLLLLYFKKNKKLKYFLKKKFKISYIQYDISCTPHLSKLLFPTLIFLYIKYKNLRKFLLFPTINFVIIGICEMGRLYNKLKKINKEYYFYIGIIYHSFLLILTFNLMCNYEFDFLFNLILMIFKFIYIKYFVPYWTYLLPKRSFYIIFIINYLLLCSYYYIKKIDF